MNLHVVKARPAWHARLVLAAAVVALLVAAWGLFELGRYRAGFDVFAAEEKSASMEAQLETVQQQVTELREQKAILERSSEIERQAYKQLEGTVNGLQAEILELKGELAFYRGIVAPDEASKGLKLQEFTLSRAALERQYTYRVVLTQVLNSGTVAYGNLQITVEGLQQGEKRAYDLASLTDATVAAGVPFRFKYFQIIEGDLTLPEGFEPYKINLIVKPKSKTHIELTQAYDWVVEEN